MNLIAALKKVVSNVDDMGKFWVVTKPTKHSSIIDVMFETDVFGFANNMSGGLKKEEVILISHDKEKAEKLAKMQVAYKIDWDGPSTVYIYDSGKKTFDIRRFDPETGEDSTGEMDWLEVDIDEFLKEATKIG